ncbi:hypothetical protein NFI96_022648 [Prochilodus magdalenae]|nr:hypothetical protein NFI96_022648 [Prochilodus magdalenae]
MKILWRRDGNEMKQNVTIGEVLPDGNGTFLRDVSISITEEDLSLFTCVVGSTSKDFPKSRNNLHPAGIAVPVFCFGLAVVLISWYWKKRQRQQQPATVAYSNEGTVITAD